MVTLLFWKTLRDMKKSAAAYGICILIVMIGFCGYCVISITADRLSASKDYFFEATNFSQGFARVVSAPASVTEKLERIRGIKRVEARLVETVRVDLENLDIEAQLQLISIHKDGLNMPYLTSGTMPSNKRELVLGDGFFKAHNYSIGDTISLIIGGQKTSFQISGSGMSPENIYMVKSIVELLPDTSSYDAAFLSRQTMEQLTGRQGLVNEFIMNFEPDIELSDIKSEIETVLKPYGSLQIYDRSEHLSCSMLQTEIDQMKRMSSAIPFLFLLVAAVILYITLNRMVEQQRTQIGTLMALGLKSKTICAHYMGFGAFVGFVGGLLGGISGNLCADPMFEYLMTYFNLPPIKQPMSLKYLFYGIVIASCFCSFLGWICARKLWKLTPAQALRPAQPKSCRLSPIEQIGFIANLFTEAGTMAIRSIFRNLRRSLISLFGIACAYMIIASLVSMNSLIDVFMFDFLDKTQQQDITIYFEDPIAADDAKRILHNSQVQLAEGVLEFPATLNGTNGTLDCTIQGIETSSQLCLLYDQAGNPIPSRDTSIILSEHMAEQLHVTTGDYIEVITLGSKPQKNRVQVGALIAQYLGSTAYVSLPTGGKISGIGNAYTSLLVKAPPDTIELLRGHLKDAAGITLIESRLGRIEKFRSLIGSMGLLMGSMAFMGVLIGFAVIYTSSLICFEEMKRELATMRMLGLRSKECLDAISIGQWFLTVGAIVLGIPMTMGASLLMSSSMGTKLYSIPNFVDSKSILFSIGLTFLAAWFSTAVIHRKLKKISPVDLLRERE